MTRTMRFLLVMWLALGMAPGLGEVAETLVHMTTSHHLAHSDADNGDLGDQGKEHGCGTTQHHCACCASQAATSVPRAEVLGATKLCFDQAVSTGSLVSLHEPQPPYRPPIAS